MFIKNANLTIFSSKTPFELTIATCNGQFITRKAINLNPSSFCLCTTACCIKLIAKYKNETITKSAILQNCHCQNLNVSFSFYSPQPSPQVQTFNLLDKTYNFPIKNAILNFIS